MIKEALEAPSVVLVPTAPEDFSPLKVLVKRLTHDALLPTKAYEGDAGWDLYANEDVEIPPFEVKLVGTGIAMAIPEGYFGRIFDRSGNATKRKFHIFAGVVDSGYRGEVKVAIYNASDRMLFIDKGTKIAQIVFLRLPKLGIKEVDELPESERGEKGFGSSG